jgi:hypothetical protein
VFVAVMRRSTGREFFPPSLSSLSSYKTMITIAKIKEEKSMAIYLLS